MADRDSAINLYEGLTVEDIDDHAIEESHSLAATSCPECTIAPSSSCDGTGMEVHFLDDDLSTALEVMGFMQVSHLVLVPWASLLNPSLTHESESRAYLLLSSTAGTL
jgi:hypothetical protein